MAALGEAASQCLNSYNPSHSPGVSHEEASPGTAHYDQEIIIKYIEACNFHIKTTTCFIFLNISKERSINKLVLKKQNIELYYKHQQRFV